MSSLRAETRYLFIPSDCQVHDRHLINVCWTSECCLEIQNRDAPSPELSLDQSASKGEMDLSLEMLVLDQCCIVPGEGEVTFTEHLLGARNSVWHFASGALWFIRPLWAGIALTTSHMSLSGECGLGAEPSTLL